MIFPFCFQLFPCYIVYWILKQIFILSTKICLFVLYIALNVQKALIKLLQFTFKASRILYNYILVRLAISSYLRFKRNTILKSKGLPVERTCLQVIVRLLVKPFRLCCIKKPSVPSKKSKFILFPSKFLFLTPFGRQIYTHFIGFIIGLLISWLLFYYFLEYKEFTRVATTLVSISILLVTTFFLAFSRVARCSVALMLPTLCSGQGRFVLILYIYNLMTIGPVTNSYDNLKQIQTSLICSRKIAVNETKELMNTYLDPIQAIKRVIENIMLSIKRFMRKIQQFIKSLSQLVKVMAAMIDHLKNWLKSMNDICFHLFEKPANKCSHIILSAEQNCRESLGFLIREICFVVRIGEIICAIMRLISSFCEALIFVFKLVGNIIISITDAIKAHVKKEFYADIDFKHDYNVEEAKKRSYKDVFNDMKKYLSKKLATIKMFNQFLSISSICFTSLILLKVLFYLHRFNVRLEFDNIYITQAIKDLDVQRMSQGKETVLPLGFKQRQRYIKPFSIRLTPNEKRKLLFGLINLSVLTAQIIFWMSIDNALYFSIKGVKRILIASSAVSSVPHLQIDVTGHNALSKFYKSLNQNMGTFEKAKDKIIFHCLSVGHSPDYQLYNKIGITLMFAFASCLFESYGLRMRHWISGKFYPRRRRERLLWLYRQLLASKGSLLKFTRRALRRKIKGDETIEKVSIVERIFALYPCLNRVRKYFVSNKRYCNLCATNDNNKVKFINCQNAGCHGIYCHDCYQELDNQCTLCLNPVEYDDAEDEDEERDSSEDELKKYETREDWSYQDSTASESDQPLASIKLERYSSLEDVDGWRSVSEESDEEKMSLKERYKRLEKELKITQSELLRMKREAQMLLEAEEDVDVDTDVTKDEHLSMNKTKAMMRQIQKELQKMN